MEAIYHNASFKTSKLITHVYSTSFSLGIRVFSKEYRNAIYSIYGYVRLADEIVDSFHSFDKRTLLNEFRVETIKAIKTGISTNPVINAFQLTVNQFNIELKYVYDFLSSMEMDLSNSFYNRKHYNEYIYGSAEVVGLMCLKVFCNKNEDIFSELLRPAKCLGSAFQKINFLRDMKSDIEERGRIYLPGIDSEIKINNVNKKLLEKDVDSELIEALRGIKRLPQGVRLGVYSAYLYYLMLFNKIKKSDVELLLKKRVRISNFSKLILLLKSFIDIKFLKTC